jgi:hypothetical protein
VIRERCHRPRRIAGALRLAAAFRRVDVASPVGSTPCASDGCWSGFWCYGALRSGFMALGNPTAPLGGHRRRESWHMDKDDTLTTAESWDRLWSATVGRSNFSLRSHLAPERSWRRLLGTLLGAPKTHDSLDVLELGCAPGDMLMQLHALRSQHRYSGLDISTAGLKITRSRLREGGYRGGSAREGHPRRHPPRSGPCRFVWTRRAFRGPG